MRLPRFPRVPIWALLPALVIGMLLGPSFAATSIKAADDPRILVEFESPGYHILTRYNGTHIYSVREGDAEEPLNVHLGPGCPANNTDMGFITRTDPNYWSVGNKAECTWILDAPGPVDINMAAGSFWKTRPPHNSASKPDHVGGTSFSAQFGVWALVE